MRSSLRSRAAFVAALLLPLAGAITPAHAASGPVSVLTTTSDLADLCRVVGGPSVSVQSLCSGPEDPHFLDARPSFLRLASRAELLVVTGLDLEVGYLPLLLRDGSNPRIKPGSPGYLDASARIRKLQVPTGGVSRALGDVHAGGNPHDLLDPANAVIVADDIAAALAALRPEEGAAFRDRAKAFRAQIQDLLLGPAPPDDPKGRRSGGLLDRFKPYKGASIVAYHENVIYLATRLGLEVLGTLEPKPGIPPTADHLASLAQQAQAAKVKAVVYGVFQPAAQATSFADRIGARPVLIAHQPGATPDAPDLLSMYRRNAETLLAALATGAPAR